MPECKQFQKGLSLVCSICPKDLCRYLSLQVIKSILDSSCGGSFLYSPGSLLALSILCNFLNSTLSRTMSGIRKEFLNKGFTGGEKQWLIKYVDDALVGSSKPELHLQVLRVIMGGLRKHGWTLNIEKGKWGVKEIDFLRYNISAAGVRPCNGLIERLGQLKQPNNRQQLKSCMVCVYNF